MVFKFLGQTANLAATNLFTPQQDQDLFVGVYLESTPQFDAGPVTIAFTDDNGSQAITSSGAIHVKAGTAVTAACSLGSATDFSLFITIN
jgi:hypothetical protein